jgi:DNA end-binding protein Ku
VAATHPVRCCGGHPPSGIGIAKFVLRDVQHLAALEAIGDALVLSTLRFADELVDESTLGFPSAKAVRKKELDLAKTLVNSLAAEWTPEKYTDDYRENLMRIIKARMKGKTARLVSEEPERDSNVVDLMERLRQSLASSKGAVKSRRASGASTRTRKRATKRHAAA